MGSRRRHGKRISQLRWCLSLILRLRLNLQLRLRLRRRRRCSRSRRCVRHTRWRRNIPGELAVRMDKSRVEPLLSDQYLIHSGRMDRERNERKLAGRDLGSNTRRMSFVPMGIGVGRKDHKVNGGFNTRELNDLANVPTVLNTRARSIRRVKVQLERNERIPPAVRNPKRLNPRIVADVPEHVWVILEAVDESDSGEDVFGRHGEELEDCAAPPPDDDTPVDKSE